MPQIFFQEIINIQELYHKNKKTPGHIGKLFIKKTQTGFLCEIKNQEYPCKKISEISTLQETKMFEEIHTTHEVIHNLSNSKGYITFFKEIQKLLTKEGIFIFDILTKESIQIICKQSPILHEQEGEKISFESKFDEKNTLTWKMTTEHLTGKEIFSGKEYILSDKELQKILTNIFSKVTIEKQPLLNDSVKLECFQITCHQ